MKNQRFHIGLLLLCLSFVLDTMEAQNCICTAANPKRCSDSTALWAFYKDTRGSGWQDFNYSTPRPIVWDSCKPMTTWQTSRGTFVELNTEGRVKKLDLNACNLIGTIPDTFWSLTAMEYLDFDAHTKDLRTVGRYKNNLSKKISPAIINWKRLKHFDIRRNKGLGCGNLFPEELLELDSLKVILIHLNYFKSGPIGNFNKLKNLDSLALNSHQLNDYVDSSEHCGLGFTKNVPFMDSCTNLSYIKLGSTDYDSLSPNAFPNIRRNGTYLDLSECLFTFDDILPYADTLQNFKYDTFLYWARYKPQKKFWQRQNSRSEPVLSRSYIFNAGLPFSINLGIDEGISDANYRNNRYAWYKRIGNDSLLIDTTTTCVLKREHALLCDIGTYYCLVTNPLLPKLTLVSEDFTIDIDGGVPITTEKLTLCADISYTFPTSQHTIPIKDYDIHRDTIWSNRCQEPIRIEAVQLLVPAKPIVANKLVIFPTDAADKTYDSAFFKKNAQFTPLSNWAVKIIDSPQIGKLDPCGMNCWVYTPQNSDADFDSFSYQICLCGNLCSPTAKLTIDLRQRIKADSLPTHVVITPNAPPNDVLVVPPKEKKGNGAVKLWIYNRFGGEVFNNNKEAYDNKWGGTDNNGTPLPHGTYTYRLTINDKPRFGTVTILQRE